MLGVAVHESGTVDETEGLNCNLKQLKAKPQTTKQHQQHALVVLDRKSTRLNSSHVLRSRMPSSA